MAKYKIVLRPTAEKDLQKLKKSGNAASIKKITTIFNDLENHPYTGIGNLFVLALFSYWASD